MLGMIWAQARGGVIGAGGTMAWHVPEDLRHFRERTGSDAVIHGRTSFEALPPRFRPLPGRRNIVLSRDPGYRPDGAEVASTLEEALALVAGQDAWICGGAQVYAQAMHAAEVLVVTEIDLEVDGDAHAPQIGAGFEMVSQGEWQGSPSAGTRYRVTEYRRPPR